MLPAEWVEDLPFLMVSPGKTMARGGCAAVSPSYNMRNGLGIAVFSARSGHIKGDPESYDGAERCSHSIRH